MNSDYIPRLRRELLRAEASRQARRRRRVDVPRPLALAAAAALVLLALVLVAPGAPDDDHAVEPTAGVTYRVLPATAAEPTAQVLRARLAGAGVERTEVAVSAGTLTITAPAAARPAVQALVQPGRFSIYDWERSVLGPRGVPAPDDPEVTGGADAGHAGALSEAEARARGGLAVHADGGWFALGGDPALTGADVERAAASTDPRIREPIVTIDFTPRGEQTFSKLTRELARRGATVDDWQHFALVLDGRLLSVPFIDFEQVPDGIDGAQGSQILGGLTPQTARQIAAMLNAGPLPATLIT